MIKEGKFGSSEATCLVAIAIVSKVFYTSPTVLMRFVGTASWYTTLISAFTAMVGFSFVYLLAKRFPDNNLVEIFEAVLGRAFGLFFSLIFVAYFLFDTAAMLSEYTEVLKIYVLPRSPLYYTIGLFVFAVVVVSLLGIEALARFSKIICGVLLISFLSVIVLSVQNYNPKNLFPLGGYGVGATLLHGLRRSSVYSYPIILAFLAQSLQGTKYIKKSGYLSIIISGLLVSLSLAAFTMTFSNYSGQEATSIMYEMTRLINYGRFVQRLDAIYLFVWNISSLISITAIFYISVSIYCKTFKINDYKPMIFPFAIMLFAIASIPNSITVIALGYIQTIREYGWIIIYCLPLIVFIIALLSKKRGAVKSE